MRIRRASSADAGISSSGGTAPAPLSAGSSSDKAAQSKPADYTGKREECLRKMLGIAMDYEDKQLVAQVRRELRKVQKITTLKKTPSSMHLQQFAEERHQKILEARSLRRIPQFVLPPHRPNKR